MLPVWNLKQARKAAGEELDCGVGGNSLTEWEKWERSLMINDSNLNTLPVLLTECLNSKQTGSHGPI